MVTRISSFSEVLDTQFHKQFRVEGSTTTGLTFGYSSGIVSQQVPVTVAAGTVALTNNATNYVYLTDAPAVAAATSIPGSGVLYVLYEVVTSGGAITTITDFRNVRTLNAVQAAAPTWTELMTALSPSIWYEMDDGPSPYANSGDAPAATTLVDGGSGTPIDQTDLVAVPEQSEAIEMPAFRSGHLRSASGVRLQMSSSPSATGTILLLFRSFGGANDRVLLTDTDAGQQDEGLIVKLENDRMRISFEDSPNAYTVTLAYSVVNVDDDNWHLLTIAQPGDGTGFDVHVDGTDYTSSLVEVAATLSRDSWFDDAFVNSDSLCIGNWDTNSPADWAPVNAVFDEFAYFDGDVLTTTENSDLWDSLSLTANSGFLHTLNEIIADNAAVAHAYLLTNVDGSQSTDAIENLADQTNWSTMTKVTATVAPGYRQAGWRTEGPKSINFDGASNAEYFTVSPAANLPMDSGFGVAIFKTDAAVSGGNDTIFSYTNNTSSDIASINVQPGGAGQLIIRQNTSSNQYNTVVDATGDTPAIDLDDTDWHLVIYNQPKDGNGIEWWLDGTKYIATDSEVTETTTGVATVDDFYDELAAVGVASFGAQDPGTPNGHFDGNIGFFALIEHDITDSEAADLWTAFSGELA